MPPIRKTHPSVAAVVEVVFIFGLHRISLYEEGSNFLLDYAVSDAFSGVPVGFVFSWSMVFRNVIPGVTVLGSSFVFGQS